MGVVAPQALKETRRAGARAKSPRARQSRGNRRRASGTRYTRQCWALLRLADGSPSPPPCPFDGLGLGAALGVGGVEFVLLDGPPLMRAVQYGSTCGSPPAAFTRVVCCAASTLECQLLPACTTMRQSVTRSLDPVLVAADGATEAVADEDGASDAADELLVSGAAESVADGDAVRLRFGDALAFALGDTLAPGGAGTPTPPR